MSKEVKKTDNPDRFDAVDSRFVEIKTRSIKGIIALSSRTLVLQVVAFVATFCLTILLSPEEYGIFFLISALINFFTYFSDVGLAAALIQKKKKLNDNDLNTTFLIQQFLVLSLVGLAFLAAPLVGRWYGLSSAGVWLFRALAFSLLLSSLKTIPSVILERKLLFNKLVLPQVFETLGFYLVAVFLAWRGFGVVSFVYAVLARGILGLVAIYILVPWRPRLSFDWRVAKKLFSFGVPFQLNSLLALIKDDLLTAFLGKVLPLAKVGYIGWAQKWAYFPFRIISDNLIRITFPVYSRLQKYPGKLKAAVEKSIFATSLLLFPIAVGLVVLSDRLVAIIPRYTKWQPAIFSLKIFALCAAIAAISTPLINTLNSLGKIKISLRFMILWTVLTWVLVPGLVLKFDYHGVSLALFLVALSSLLILPKISRILNIRLGKDLVKTILASVLMGGFLAFSNRFLKLTIGGLFFQAILGAGFYFLITWLINKRRLLGLVQMIKSVF